MKIGRTEVVRALESEVTSSVREGIMVLGLQTIASKQNRVYITSVRGYGGWVYSCGDRRLQPHPKSHIGSIRRSGIVFEASPILSDHVIGLTQYVFEVPGAG